MKNVFFWSIQYWSCSKIMKVEYVKTKTLAQNNTLLLYNKISSTLFFKAYCQPMYVCIKRGEGERKTKMGSWGNFQRITGMTRGGRGQNLWLHHLWMPHLCCISWPTEMSDTLPENNLEIWTRINLNNFFFPFFSSVLNTDSQYSKFENRVFFLVKIYLHISNMEKGHIQ